MTQQTGMRRRFIATAGAASGAAALGFPAIVKAQTTSLRFQSTWPAKDIFHEYANDFAKKVNDMTGGELKIEVLPAGSVVPAFGLLDAVSKGTLVGGHGVLAYHYGNRKLVFLKHPDVVAVVRDVADYATLQDALGAHNIQPSRWPSFVEAIDSLAASDIIRVR
jgi:putative mycofactocin binding protein MftB